MEDDREKLKRELADLLEKSADLLKRRKSKSADSRDRSPRNKVSA